MTDLLDVDFSTEKSARAARFERSRAAREHRKLVKSIKDIKEAREGREDDHLYEKHLHLMQDQKKIPLTN